MRNPELVRLPGWTRGAANFLERRIASERTREEDVLTGERHALALEVSRDCPES